MTVRELCERYLGDAEKGLILGKGRRPKKQSTLAIDRGRIERHLLPLLGNRRVKDISLSDVNGFVRDIASGKTQADIKTGHRGRAIVRGGIGTAARTVGLLGGILTYAVDHGVIERNPANGGRARRFDLLASRCWTFSTRYAREMPRITCFQARWKTSPSSDFLGNGSD